MRRAPYVFLKRGKSKIARKESNSSSERSAKNKSAKQKKEAPSTLDEDQLEELTSWIF